MPQYCHTCGGDLPAVSGETPFCPHCGAPQLTLALDYQDSGAEQAGDTSAEGSSTGTRPPPRPQVVDWKMAIQCASAVAAVGGLLAVGALRLPVLTGASVLWLLSGSLITLALYQNRRPAARMDMRIGVRIGLVVGVCLAAGLALAMAAAGVVARFGMRAMGSFDAQLATIFAKVVQQSARQSATPLPPEALRLIASPEFRAAYVLFSCGITVILLLVLSAVGGAFAGLLRTRHTPAQT